MKPPMEILGQTVGVVVFFALFFGGRALIRKAWAKLKPSPMSEVIREVDELLAANPQAAAARPAILAELKSHERGLLAQLRHGKVTAREVAARFAGTAA